MNELVVAPEPDAAHTRFELKPRQTEGSPSAIQEPAEALGCIKMAGVSAGILVKSAWMSDDAYITLPI